MACRRCRLRAIHRKPAFRGLFFVVYYLFPFATIVRNLSRFWS
ncbi:hypothetical protein HMPREF1584_01006 [Gardnerella vaginalis JCP8481A]|nr:hypothetical protein HMPREF1584_01006 [Gardnerella vaginalis JCP8481A]